MLKRILYFFLLLCSLCACKHSPIDEYIPVSTVAFNQTEAELVMGETLQLLVQITPSNATEQTLMWGSTNKAVATVSESGLVTAVGAGTTKVTASVGGKTASCQVFVRKATVDVEAVTLDKEELELEEGQTEALVATVTPDNATNKTVEWSSGNNNIADVDENGNVTAVAEGHTTITAQAGGKTATCLVIVNKKIIHVESIEISKASLNLIVGTSESLAVTVLPEDATDNSVTWASSNPDIAEVDQTGTVTAKSVGTTTITATAADGGKVAACEVSAYVPFIPATDISLDKSSLTLEQGQTLTLNATVFPENASVKTVTWFSSDVNVASVDQDGKVTAVAGGSATITARTGDISATCEVIVPYFEIAPTTKSVSAARETFTVTISTNQGNATGSSNAGWVTVSGNSVTVAANPNTEARSATVTFTAGSLSKTLTINQATHDWVDLGLPSGLKWAPCNVGANSPEEYGDYFAWGETEPYYTEGHSQDNPCSNWKTNKTGYDWASYKFELGTDYNGPFSKYVTKSSYGTVDNKTVLDPEDDAASVNWGGSWRMPSAEEWDELIDNCTWTWTTQNGVNGRLVTGPNGNSIFLPAAGLRTDTSLDYAGSYCFYWSSSLNTGNPISAWCVRFNSDQIIRDKLRRRCFGQSVRPVTE